MGAAHLHVYMAHFWMGRSAIRGQRPIFHHSHSLSRASSDPAPFAGGVKLNLMLYSPTMKRLGRRLFNLAAVISGTGLEMIK